jgi:biopolymer transport protein TolR
MSDKKFSAAQLAWINRKSKPKAFDPADGGGELNIVPFLDIIMNILMFILASITTVFTATIPVPAPSTGGGGAPSAEVNITLKVVREGYIIGGPDGFFQAGCNGLGPATVAIPLLNGQHNFAELTRCMQAVRAFPQYQSQLQDNHKIQIAGNQDVPYRVLIGTLDAVRESRLGAKDMFTEPTLGLLN